MKTLISLVKALLIRPALRRPVRFALTIAGVASGIAVLTAIHLANQSSINSFRDSIEKVAGKATHQIISPTGDLNEAILLDLVPFRVEGVSAAPVIERDALLVDQDLSAKLLAFDLIGDVRFRDYSWSQATTTSTPSSSTAGAEWFLALFASDSAVLPSDFARRLGVTVGDSINLSSAGVRRRLVVRAILEESEDGAFTGNLIVMDIGAAQSSFDLVGRLDRIDLIIDSEEPDRVADRVDQVLPAGLRTERPSGRSRRVAQMADAFRINLLALGAISVLVGTLLVFNTLTISFLNLRPSLGTLYAIGTKPSEIAGVFLLSAALIGLAGSILGVIGGYLLASAILSTVGATITNLYMEANPQAVNLGGVEIIAAIGLGVTISLIAAARPAMEAAAVPIAELARRERVEVDSRPGWITRIVLVGLTLGLAWLATTIPPLGRISIGGYIATLLLLVAGALLVSPLLLQFARSSRGLLTRVFGAPGLVASASIPAARSRAVVASVALMVAIAMMVAVAMMVGSFRETVIEWVDQTIQSDLWVRPTSKLGANTGALFPPSIVAQTEALDYVAGVDFVRTRTIEISGSRVQLVGTNLVNTTGRERLPMLRPDRPTSDILAEAVRSGGALVSEAFTTHFKLDVGDTIPFETANLEIPISGVYRDYSSDRGVIVIDSSLYREIFDDDAIDTLAVYLNPNEDADDAAARIEVDLAAYNVFIVRNSTIRAEVIRIFDQTFAITWTLLGIAMIVATTGIFSTIHAIVIERIRELAMLRVIGMTAAQLKGMVTIESTLIGLTTNVIGGLCGLGLALILIRVIQQQAFGWTIDIHPPGAIIAVSLLLTMAASMFAGFLASRYAVSADLLEATRSE